MRAIQEIFTKPIAAFVAFQQIKSALAAQIDKRNAITAYVASLEKSRNESVAALFTESTVENFKRAVAARIEFENAQGVLVDVLSSLSQNGVADLTESSEAMDTLQTALEAYASELESRIEALRNDARALADRSGVDYFEPPACAILEGERVKANDGASSIRQGTGDPKWIWQTYAPLIRIGSGALSLPK